MGGNRRSSFLRRGRLPCALLMPPSNVDTRETVEANNTDTDATRRSSGALGEVANLDDLELTPEGVGA